MNPYPTLLETEYSPALGAVEEPLSLATVKEYLGLPEMSPEDTGKDDELAILIAAARESAEGEWGGPIKLKQYVKAYDCWPCEIPLKSPLGSVDLFRYRDEDGDWTTLAEGTDYIIDERKNPAIITLPPDGTWPTASLWPSSAIEVYFSAGYADEADIPAKLKKGMLMLVSHWFTNKVPVQSFAGQPQEVPFTVKYLLQGPPRP